jgi:acyl-CoA synthetase (AMP-forming)/AMP-acid ligase II
MEHNLWRIFSSVSAAAGDREAIVWRRKRLTYSGLAERARRLANVLVEAGLGTYRERPGLAPWEIGQDSVGLYMLNGPEYLEATLAGYGARTAPFNVNYRYVAQELAYLLEDAHVGAIIYHARFASTLAEVLPRLTRKPLLLQVADETTVALLPGAVDYESALSNTSPEPPTLVHDPDDLYLLYTGGTTGMPKGTMWRQADIWVAALSARPADRDIAAIAATVTETLPQRILPNAPLMHGAAHWLALRALLSGGTVIINTVVDRLDPVDVWTLIQQERIETTLMVGEAFARPLIAELEAGTYDASTLTLVAVGGAATSPETKGRLLDLLPHAHIADVAGSSETGSALSQVSSTGTIGEHGVFLPIPEVAVLNAELNGRLGPGDATIGWFAKSGRIPLGYLGDRSKTEATFPIVEGIRWSVPGDRARIRADGMVELLGRDSVTINSAGEKIFAEEVERAIIAQPAVDDVIVVGRPSERWGQECVAVVAITAGSGITDAELIDAASARIARYKLPKAIIRVPAVQRSPAGKADYAWARQITNPSTGRQEPLQTPARR